MQVGINIGQNRHYELREALLIYRSTGHRNWDRGSSFVTHHMITADNGTRPELGAAKPLTDGFLRSLVRSLGAMVAAEFFPENILARTEQMVTWWTPAQSRTMFFENTEEILSDLSGKTFPQPPLIWCTQDGGLWVRALKENKRPDPDTKLCFAPYWNLSESGDVCLGSMKAPGIATISAISQWEKGFYESAFTHGNVGRIVRHPGGFEGLWRELVEQETFPVENLVDLPQTVAEFIQPGRSRYV